MIFKLRINDIELDTDGVEYFELVKGSVIGSDIGTINREYSTNITLPATQTNVSIFRAHKLWGGSSEIFKGVAHFGFEAFECFIQLVEFDDKKIVIYLVNTDSKIANLLKSSIGEMIGGNFGSRSPFVYFQKLIQDTKYDLFEYFMFDLINDESDYTLIKESDAPVYRPGITLGNLINMTPLANYVSLNEVSVLGDTLLFNKDTARESPLTLGINFEMNVPSFSEFVWESPLMYNGVPYPINLPTGNLKGNYASVVSSHNPLNMYLEFGSAISQSAPLSDFEFGIIENLGESDENFTSYGDVGYGRSLFFSTHRPAKSYHLGAVYVGYGEGSLSIEIERAFIMMAITRDFIKEEVSDYFDFSSYYSSFGNGSIGDLLKSLVIENGKYLSVNNVGKLDIKNLPSIESGDVFDATHFFSKFKSAKRKPSPVLTAQNNIIKYPEFKNGSYDFINIKIDKGTFFDELEKEAVFKELTHNRGLGLEDIWKSDGHPMFYGTSNILLNNMNKYKIFRDAHNDPIIYQIEFKGMFDVPESILYIEQLNGLFLPEKIIKTSKNVLILNCYKIEKQ